MDKKGRIIASALIVLFAFAVAAAAIFVYLEYAADNSSNSRALSEMSALIEFNHKYILKQADILGRETLSLCVSCSDEALKERFIILSAENEANFRYEGMGNFYGKIRNGEFEIHREGEVLRLEINNLFVEAKRDSNRIRREFGIALDINAM